MLLPEFAAGYCLQPSEMNMITIGNNGFLP